MTKFLFIIGAGASKSVNPKFPTGKGLIEKLQSIKLSTNNITTFKVGQNYIPWESTDGKTFKRIDLNPPKPSPSIDISEIEKILLKQYNQIFSSMITNLYQITGKDNVKVQYLEGERETVMGYDIMFDLTGINPIDFLIATLLTKYKPESIDYFVEDLPTLIKPYVEKAKAFGILQEGENLAEKVTNRIKEKIIEILEKIEIGDHTESYLYQILFNKIRLNQAQDIKIITFNYDLVIETIIEKMNDERLKAIKPTHIYGDIKSGIDFIRSNKRNNEYKQEFKKAENIYFIGYGFDDENSKLLGLTNMRKNVWTGKKVFITNYDGVSSLEYKASKIFHANFEFTREQSRKYISFERNFYAFISERKSYIEAIEKDFFFEK